MIFRLGAFCHHSSTPQGLFIFLGGRHFSTSHSQYEKAKSQYVREQYEMKQTRMLNVFCKWILCICIICETRV